MDSRWRQLESDRSDGQVLMGKFPNFPWPDELVDVGERLKGYRKEKLSLFRQLAWLLFPGKFREIIRYSARRWRQGGRPSFYQWKLRLAQGRDAFAPKPSFELSSDLTIRPVCRGCRILANLPLFHSFGFTITTLYPLLEGLEIVSAPSPLDLVSSLRAIREEQVDVLMGTPTFLKGYLRKAKAGDLASVKYVVAGAERTPPSFRERWEKEVGCKYLEGYGLTEASPVLSFNVPGDGSRQNSVGRLLPGSK